MILSLVPLPAAVVVAFSAAGAAGAAAAGAAAAAAAATAAHGLLLCSAYLLAYIVSVVTILSKEEPCER